MASELQYTEGQMHGPIANCKRFIRMNSTPPLECVELLSKSQKSKITFITLKGVALTEKMIKLYPKQAQPACQKFLKLIIKATQIPIFDAFCDQIPYQW